MAKFELKAESLERSPEQQEQKRQELVLLKESMYHFLYLFRIDYYRLSVVARVNRRIVSDCDCTVCTAICRMWYALCVMRRVRLTWGSVRTKCTLPPPRVTPPALLTVCKWPLPLPLRSEGALRSARSPLRIRIRIRCTSSASLSFIPFSFSKPTRLIQSYFLVIH